MQTAQPSLLSRSDTLLGACEGLGEDFGFNPQYLRVALAALLFWSPLASVGAYALIAAAVLLSRWLFPNPQPASHQLDAVGAPLTAGNDGDAVELAAAA